MDLQKPLHAFAAAILFLTMAGILWSASASAELPDRGYQPRLCGLDMNRNGIIGEPADCNVCTGDTINNDPDGDGENENIIYVSCAKGATASRPAGANTDGCGMTPGAPCATIEHAFTMVADGVGDGNHEDIVCFRNICVEESLTPVHSGEATTYQMPATPSEAQPWVRGSNPTMLIGWDSDGDNTYPPEDSDDVAILEPPVTCPGKPNLPCDDAPIVNPDQADREFYQKKTERAFQLGGRIHYFEMAHFSVRDYGRFTLTDNSGFIEFNVQGNSYIDMHDLHLVDLNRHGNYNGTASTVNMFRFRANHVRFENILFSNNGHWLARGDGGDGPTSGDGGPYGPTRWQNITVKANACWAKGEARCVKEIHCPEDEFPTSEYPKGCCATGPICIAEDPADCEPGATDICKPQETTHWKIWGYLSGIEILDSVIDTNLTDRDNVEPSGSDPRGIDITQCSQDWTIRNNELIDWAQPIQVAPYSFRFCDTDGVARPVDNVVIDQNVIEGRRCWGGGKRAITLKEGGTLPGHNLKDITITNNVIRTSSAWDGCLQIASGNDGGPVPGTITFANNTCHGRLGAISAIVIDDLIASRNQDFMPQNIVIKNNIISGVNGDDNVRTTYEPTNLDMNFNVFDSDGDYRWNNVRQFTLANWQAASNADASSTECIPQYVDVTGGDLHLDPADTCAQDQGTPITAATENIDDEARNQGAGWDIGADEVPSAVVPEADLATTARALPASTSVNGMVRYLVMVTNFGPDAAPETEVQIDLPDGLTLLGNSCGAAAPQGSQWSWALGTLSPNASSRIRPRCLLTFRATAAGAQILDTAVSSTADDSNASNNQKMTTITVN